jgi:hypothetical protein
VTLGVYVSQALGREHYGADLFVIAGRTREGLRRTARWLATKLGGPRPVEWTAPGVR